MAEKGKLTGVLAVKYGEGGNHTLSPFKNIPSSLDNHNHLTISKNLVQNPP